MTTPPINNDSLPGAADDREPTAERRAEIADEARRQTEARTRREAEINRAQEAEREPDAPALDGTPEVRPGGSNRDAARGEATTDAPEPSAVRTHWDKDPGE